MRNSLNRFRRDGDGAVAVEFALVLPFLLVLIIGSVYFGYLFGLSHSLQTVAAEAARASLRGVTVVERLAFARTALAEAASATPLINATKLTGTVSEVVGASPGVRVIVTYDLQGSLLDTLPTPWLSADGMLQREAYLVW